MHIRLVRALAQLAVAVLLADGLSAAAAFELTPATDEVDNAGQTLIVEHELVTLTVLSYSAGMDDRLGWDGLAPAEGISCRSVPPGFTQLLGRFYAPSELRLSLAAGNDVWTTGPAERNGDGTVHARLTAVAPDTIVVEWEDLPTDGDRDFDDCVVLLGVTPLAPCPSRAQAGH